MSSLHCRNGTWYLLYYLNGKQKWRSLKTADKKTAKSLMRKFDTEFDQVRAGVAKPKVEISDGIDMFLSMKRKTVQPAMITRYKQMFRHILAFCKDRGITHFDDFQSRHPIEYVAARKERAQKTIKEELQALKAVFRHLTEEGYLGAPPITRWPNLKTTTDQPERIGHYTREEIELLKNHLATNPAYDHFLFLLYTGCRRSELARLVVQDVDFERQTIRITNKKTGTSMRDQFRMIEIHDQILEILQNRCRGKRAHDPVFPETQDHPVNWLARLIQRACKRCKIPYKRCHGIRHTFISSLLVNGTPVRVVQAMVGHKNFSTTMRYSHVSPDDLKGRIKNLDY